MTKFNGGAMLPADFFDKAAAGIAESRASTIVGGGGKRFLRLIKSGDWVYGQENEEVQEGSRWIVNTLSITHGWSCWVDGELRGEVMASIVEHKPERPPSIDGKPYAEQRAFDLRCMDGDDAGEEVHYKTTSLGGVERTLGLLAQIQARLQTRTPYAFPVLTLGEDYYQHPKFGRIYKPIFTVVGWANIDGQVEGETPSPKEGVPAPTATKARKAPLVAASEPAEEPAAAPVHTGQRRRPAARQG